MLDNVDKIAVQGDGLLSTMAGSTNATVGLAPIPATHADRPSGRGAKVGVGVRPAVELDQSTFWQGMKVGARQPRAVIAVCMQTEKTYAAGCGAWCLLWHRKPESAEGTEGRVE